MHARNTTYDTRPFGDGWVWLCLCLISAALYVPTARAGWVIDAVGWLHDIQTYSVADYLNRTHSQVQSMYQFTQGITYVFYMLWGSNVYMWSLLYILLHGTNCYLLFLSVCMLLQYSGFVLGWWVALAAAMLLLTAPTASEAVAWKACYHYLQGLCFVLFIWYALLQYLFLGRSGMAWWAALVFGCAILSLEVFMMIPFMCLATIGYYAWVIKGPKVNTYAALWKFVLPQLGLLGLYFVVFVAYYGGFQPHEYNLYAQGITTYLGKPLKHLFHLLLWGRYYPLPIKTSVYAGLDTGWVQALCYALLGGLWWRMWLLRHRGAWGAVALLLCCAGFMLVLLMPLPFPPAAQWVFYDRYGYFAMAFLGASSALVLYQIFQPKWATLIMGALVLIQAAWTLKLNFYWKDSAYVNHRLLTTLPRHEQGTVVLLNLPENMEGVPMIGADSSGMFQEMQWRLYGIQTKAKIYDVLAFNMLTKDDGATAEVLNDSTLQVTLNQWGTWWWYMGHGATSYSTADFTVNVTDPGHQYRITFKQPLGAYFIYYFHHSRWVRVGD